MRETIDVFQKQYLHKDFSKGIEKDFWKRKLLLVFPVPLKFHTGTVELKKKDGAKQCLACTDAASSTGKKKKLSSKRKLKSVRQCLRRENGRDDQTLWISCIDLDQIR